MESSSPESTDVTVSGRPHFFKIMFAPKQLKTLALPKKFVKNHGKGLPTHAYLNVPNGAKWPVKLVEEEGIVWFQNGWDDFVAHYSIAIGHFLVFRYESADSDFHVLIFDHSATEVDYGVVGDSGERGIGHGSGSCTSDAGPKSQDASQVGKNKESGGDTVGPNTTTVAAAEAEEDRETSDDDDVSIEILDHAGDDGGLEFKSNGDDEEKTEASVRTSRQRAVGRADAFQRKCKNPSFMLTIVPCCLTKPYVMHIPNHARKYFPENGKGSHRIIILGRNRKKWLVKYHVGSTRAFNFTGGWKSFTMDNHLRVGHVCVFEFMNHKKLQVTIFR